MAGLQHDKDLASISDGFGGAFNFQKQNPFNVMGSRGELSVLQEKYTALQAQLASAIQQSDSHKRDWMSCQSKHDQMIKKMDAQMEQFGSLQSDFAAEQKARVELATQLSNEQTQMKSIEAELVSCTNDKKVVAAAVAEREMSLQRKIKEVQDSMAKCEASRQKQMSNIPERQELVGKLEEAKVAVKQLHRMHMGVVHESAAQDPMMAKKTDERKKLWSFMNTIQSCVKQSDDVKKCASMALSQFKGPGAHDGDHHGHGGHHGGKKEMRGQQF